MCNLCARWLSQVDLKRCVNLYFPHVCFVHNIKYTVYICVAILACGHSAFNFTTFFHFCKLALQISVKITACVVMRSTLFRLNWFNISRWACILYFKNISMFFFSIYNLHWKNNCSNRIKCLIQPICFTSNLRRYLFMIIVN